MKISEKQVLRLLRICRRYASVCGQMDWKDRQEECKELHREIENQQSDELKELNENT